MEGVGKCNRLRKRKNGGKCGGEERKLIDEVFFFFQSILFLSLSHFVVIFSFSF
ncbi:hypothetical protein LguiB_025772 [Lonicera macranthoides]